MNSEAVLRELDCVGVGQMGFPGVVGNSRHMGAVMGLLWSVLTPRRAAEQSNSTIHHPVSQGFLIANDKGLSLAPVRPGGQWSLCLWS